MNSYEAKQERRLERAKELAEKNRKLAEQTMNHAKEMADVIPFGQPILVGHHSEKADRSYRKRIDNKFRKASEQYDKARYYEQKAKTIENNNTISSDDPDAILKLEEKIKGLEYKYEETKKLKKIPRDYSFSPEDMRSLHMTSIKTEIRRCKKRIDELKAKQQNKSLEVDKENPETKVRVYTDKDENRVRIEHPSKPSKEVIQELKSNGFRWSPYNQAWQKTITEYHISQALKLAGIPEDQPKEKRKLIFNDSWHMMNFRKPTTKLLEIFQETTDQSIKDTIEMILIQRNQEFKLQELTA